jgi:hypothetical protein
MTRHRINEAAFEIPERWRDKTVHVFVEGDALPASFSFVINKDRLGENEEPVEFAERQLTQLAGSLSDFRVADRGQRPVSGAPALILEFTWSADQGRMRQRQVFVTIGRDVLILTATALDAFTEDQIRDLDALLDSFELQRDA